jgi:hypothetical protein
VLVIPVQLVIWIFVFRFVNIAVETWDASEGDFKVVRILFLGEIWYSWLSISSIGISVFEAIVTVQGN